MAIGYLEEDGRLLRSGATRRTPFRFRRIIYTARIATAQTSRRFLSPTRKDCLIQLPALDCVLSRLAAVYC